MKYEGNKVSSQLAMVVRTCGIKELLFIGSFHGNPNRDTIGWRPIFCVKEFKGWKIVHHVQEECMEAFVFYWKVWTRQLQPKK